MAIEGRLDEVVYRGYAMIAYSELYAWYSRERLTQNVYRHLVDTYERLAKDRPSGAIGSLRVLVDDGGYLLVDGKRLSRADVAFGLEKD